ncbi:MAG: hypothetical protein DMF04_09035 [Verrucomicrobia bacterium]|nr:MAG: hypothetical protein DMF04_09035 [Verrucomicrobiota bacterium]
MALFSPHPHLFYILLADIAFADRGETGLKEEFDRNGYAPNRDVESVLWRTLPPCTFSAQLKDANGGSGIGLFEL